MTCSNDSGIWIETANYLPPEDELVETKVDEPPSCYNLIKLKLVNNVWLYENNTPFEGRQPTHWHTL